MRDNVKDLEVGDHVVCAFVPSCGHCIPCREGRPALCEKGAIFGCAVITGIGAIINTAQVKPGSTVAVVGFGGIGLNAIIGAQLAGASKIIALDINPNKLDI